MLIDFFMLEIGNKSFEKWKLLNFGIFWLKALKDLKAQKPLKKLKKAH